MRVLVCGGRDYFDERTAYDALDALHRFRPITTIIEGGASGADRLGFWWAKARRVEVVTYRADWSMGRKAGPVRNQRMLDEAKPDLVLAFPGKRGTADMIRRAGVAHVPVREVEA